MSKLVNDASSGMTTTAVGSKTTVNVKPNDDALYYDKRLAEDGRRWTPLYEMGNVARDGCRARTTATSLDEGTPWILSRTLPGFPDHGGGRFFRSDYIPTWAAAATGRLPRPRTPLRCRRLLFRCAARFPPASTDSPAPLDDEGISIVLPPNRTTWRKSKICMFGVWVYWFPSNRVRGCVRACVCDVTHKHRVRSGKYFSKSEGWWRCIVVYI